MEGFIKLFEQVDLFDIANQCFLHFDNALGLDDGWGVLGLGQLADDLALRSNPKKMFFADAGNINLGYHGARLRIGHHQTILFKAQNGFSYGGLADIEAFSQFRPDKRGFRKQGQRNNLVTDFFVDQRRCRNMHAGFHRSVMHRNQSARWCVHVFVSPWHLPTCPCWTEIVITSMYWATAMSKRVLLPAERRTAPWQQRTEWMHVCIPRF